MPEIRKTDDQTWIFDEGGVRFFLLEGEDKALLIDSGMQTRNARELAQELTDKPVELLNTHADPDHIGSNDQFERFYMSAAEATNYYKSMRGAGELVPVWDGGILDLGERPLKIIAMPGHTPGSIAVLDVKYRRLISGDPVQTGRIFMFGPQREMHAYLRSLERLETMAGEFDEIWPSHAACPIKPDVLPKLIEAAKSVLTGTAPGEAINMHGRTIIARDMGVATFLCDAE